MKKIAANDSRQSVGLKWKTRKGLEKLIDFDGDKITIGGDIRLVSSNDPTAENIARWCTEQVPQCYKAMVQESTGNIAIYEEDE